MSLFDNMTTFQLGCHIATILNKQQFSCRENGKAISKGKALYEMQARLLTATLRTHCEYCGNSGPPSLTKAKRMVKKFKFTAFQGHNGVIISLKGRSLK